MKKILSIFAVLATVFTISCSSTGLKSSNMGGFGPLKARLPYANYVDYYGYVSKDVKPDGKYKGKDAFYLYVWVPAVIDEIGVSMYSPADKQPEEGDFKHAAFDKGFKADSNKYFDTYLVLEKLKVFDSKSIKRGGSPMSTLAINDDTSEMRKNPAGLSRNSLLRHKSDVKNPLKALVRGLYRISFTSFRGGVSGSYIATVGTNVPGVKIASSLQELHKIVNTPAE